MVEVRLEGDGGACGEGSEKMREPGEGRLSHGGVSLMRLGMSNVTRVSSRVSWLAHGARLEVERFVCDAPKRADAADVQVASYTSPNPKPLQPRRACHQKRSAAANLTVCKQRPALRFRTTSHSVSLWSPQNVDEDAFHDHRPPRQTERLLRSQGSSSSPQVFSVTNNDDRKSADMGRSKQMKVERRRKKIL
jgi:hypothetical protein